MEKSSNLVIDTRDLSRTYKGTKALRSLNLKVQLHSICGFLGPNGAGKTTTIKLLLGLIRPTSGSGSVFGHDLVTDSVEIRRRVGYLAQDPRYYDYLSARETLRFTAGFFFKGPAPIIEERIQETLDLVGLTDKADRPIKSFSGGERQRLGIAQAQVNHPDLLILDEPAAALDPQGRHDVLDVMGKLRKHTTIFYSTHILEDVQRISDSVAILNNGALVAQAPINDLLNKGRDITYTFKTRGFSDPIRGLLNNQPWISSIMEEREKDHTLWQVSVTHEDAAEDNLMRLITSVPGLRVAEFGRHRLNLEKVFLDMVKDENLKEGSRYVK